MFTTWALRRDEGGGSDGLLGLRAFEVVRGLDGTVEGCPHKLLPFVRRRLVQGIGKVGGLVVVEGADVPSPRGGLLVLDAG
ncbi:hypothetical protein GCM10010398_63310 [Streptomyces fimbriatus]